MQKSQSGKLMMRRALYALIPILLCLSLSAGSRAYSQANPAPKSPAPVQQIKNLPDPGRFEPYPEYLDENSEASMNFRTYSPLRQTSGFNTIKALREEREKMLQARMMWMRGTTGSGQTASESTYHPTAPKVTTPAAKSQAPVAPAKPQAR